MATTTASPPGYEYDRTTGAPVMETPIVERRMKRISWPGVWAGLFVALAIQILLALLAFGTGLAAIDPWNADAKTVGITSGIFWLISCAISLFFGGWVAARIAGVPRQTERIMHGGMIHGLVTWSFATVVFTFILLNWLSAMLSTTTEVAADVAARAPAASATAIRDLTSKVSATTAFNNIRSEARDMLVGEEPKSATASRGKATRNTRNANDEELTAAQVDNLVNRMVQGDHGAMINTLTAYTDMSRNDAAQTVQRWTTNYQQSTAPVPTTITQPSDIGPAVTQRLNNLADRISDWVAAASLWGFFTVLCSAIAAALGGIAGSWDMRKDYAMAQRGHVQQRI